MNKCSVCTLEKPPSDFYFRKDYARYRSECKRCFQERVKKRRDENLSLSRERAKKSYEKHREKRLKYAKNYRENPKNLPQIRAAKSRYKYTKKQSTPKWLTNEQLHRIKYYYELVPLYEKKRGESFQVDHIIPLQGKDVCGLHVPWNLQVISTKANLIKSNRRDTFVFPADVVSMLGDGDSNEGARILQDMINRIRMQKTNTEEQAEALE